MSRSISYAKVNNMASIGTGRMGRSDMKECLYQGLKVNARVVAVCDVDSKLATIAKKEIDGIYAKELGAGNYDGVQIYGDYRELLERKDIDGVTISTPDHWHGLIAVAAGDLTFVYAADGQHSGYGCRKPGERKSNSQDRIA